MAIPTLPFDIITDILSRLPSKTLIRFKSVSKQWYSLINSPNFINLHLTQALISQNSPILIISQFSLSSVAIPDENNPNFHLSELDHPLKHFCKRHDFSPYHRNRPQILGSINGVVCISMYDKSSVVLYNPSTKTHRFIPPFTPSPNTNPYSAFNRESNTINIVLFGFGFDSVSGDYKLLRIIDTLKNKRVTVYREASVYSLKNDSWKCVDNLTMTGQFLFQNSMGVFVNEVLHFIGIDSNFKSKVKCFDLRTETFSFMDLTKFDERNTTHDIQELGGCLCVIVNFKKIDRSSMAGHFALARVDLWVMKEYGNTETWVRLFSICDPARLEALTRVRPVVYSGDKERVLLELDSLSLGWYSWGTKSFERITVHGWLADALCETWTFVESLVSIRMDNDKDKDKLKPKAVPKKIKNKRARDDFLSSGFKLRL